MDRETLNLLIGAGISIFASLVSILASNFFQVKKDARERNYSILLDRINQLEDFSKKIVITLGQVSITFRAEYTRRTNQEREKYLDEFMQNIISLYPQYGYYSGVALYLGGDVAKIFGEILQRPNQLFNELFQLQNALLSGEKQDEYLRRIVEEFEYIQTYSALLAAFDKIKANPRKI